MEEPQSEIQQFYDGQSVFITGGTGFMGKVLIEKILRTCSGVKKIFLLIRPKKNVSIQERLDKIFSGKVFSILAEQQPNFKQKLVPIAGDCSLPGMGLSENDKKTIIQEVSILFHMAATTRFDEVLSSAIRINVVSVKCVIDMCKQMKNFKVGVYVSTAYSNCVKHEIGETIYDSALNYDECVALMKIFDKQPWNTDDKDLVTKKFIGDWPNSYTFTKAIAEKTIDDYARNLPFCIVRPSIVSSTFNEPIPGWTDNLLGPTGLITAIGMGIVHVAYVDGTKHPDLVPCDMACHAIVASAWETGVKKRPEDPIPVYNFTNRGAITWSEVKNLCMNNLYLNPSVYILYYPWIFLTTSRKLFKFCQFFMMCLPALIVDFATRFKGQKIKAYKIYKLAAKHTDMLSFFSLSEWKFSYEKLDLLYENMNERDKQLFPFSLKGFDWAEFFVRFVPQLKVMYTEKLIKSKLVKPKVDDFESAKNHWNRLKFIHYTLTTTVVILLCWLFYKVLYILF